MSTKPVDSLLPLEVEENVNNVLSQYSNAIHELVCFGTHILEKGLKQNEPNKDHSDEIVVVKSLLFRHILELADAISVQIEKGVNAPCKIHMRSILEASLSLEYILESDTEFRSACYLITDFYKRLKAAEKLVPGTDSNKKHLTELKKYSEHGQIFDNIDATRDYNRFKTLIDKRQYSKAKKAYQAYVNGPKKRSNVNWFSIVDPTINDLFVLAQKLKRQEQHTYFYKIWSDTTHGSGIWSNVLVGGDDGYGAIVQLRDPTESKDMAHTCITLCLHSFDNFITKVIPTEKPWFSNWYKWYVQMHRNPVRSTNI